MKKAFTLIELLVAVAILAMVISFTSVIFRFGIDAHRFSAANAEIMQKLRAITSQLNSDFKCLRKDAPLIMWFQKYPTDSWERYDQIMFFANGDFSSTQQYYNGEPDDKDGDTVIRGNVARINYALARGFDPSADEIKDQPFHFKNKQDQTLGRRCHILTNDGKVDGWPDGNDVGTTIDDAGAGGEYKNELYEHDSVPIARWKTLDNTDYGGGKILKTVFEYPPLIDIREPSTFHKLMCEGVGSFKIQWAYWDKNRQNDMELRWFPDNDPDNDRDNDDSHFSLMETNYGIGNEKKFGILFNILDNPRLNKWFSPGSGTIEYNKSGDKFPQAFFPQALKFTFTLYDSKNVIKGGRTFTHIVYLGD